MQESPFATVARILGEPSNAFDDLRIIASSATRLDTPTRELITAAADELEATQKMLVSTQAKLIEAQAKLIAVNERLIVAQRPSPPWNWNMFWSVK